MKYMGSQIVFNILKIKKFYRPIDQMLFHLQLESQILQAQSFRQNHKGNYIALLNTHKNKH